MGGNEDVDAFHGSLSLCGLDDAGLVGNVDGRKEREEGIGGLRRVGSHRAVGTRFVVSTWTATRGERDRR